jgi:hypothetical protein
LDGRCWSYDSQSRGESVLAQSGGCEFVEMSGGIYAKLGEQAWFGARLSVFLVICGQRSKYEMTYIPQRRALAANGATPCLSGTTTVELESSRPGTLCSTVTRPTNASSTPLQPLWRVDPRRCRLFSLKVMSKA